MKRIFTLLSILVLALSINAQEQQVIDITLVGMTKTPVSRMGSYRFLLLEDAIGNQLSIYNGKEDAYGDFDVYGYLSEYNVSVSGTGTWAVVDGVETLTATLQEEDNATVLYRVTAKLVALETYNLTCNDAHYYTPNNSFETVFIGQVDGLTLKIVVEYMTAGVNNDVLGVYGETDILAETLKVSGKTTCTISGTFHDAIGNTYNVTMTATQLQKTPIDVVNATCSEVDGNVCVTGTWNDTDLSITLYGFSTTDNILYEEALMEVGDIVATSTQVTLNKTESDFTLSGEFIHSQETAIYTVTITGTAATTALEQITTNKNVFKTIRDGQLLIYIDSVIYSAEGQKL